MIRVITILADSCLDCPFFYCSICQKVNKRLNLDDDAIPQWCPFPIAENKGVEIDVEQWR